jgi:putative iron-regulated protein
MNTILKRTSLVALATIVTLSACRKKKEEEVVATPATAETLSQEVIVSFANKIALPQYNDMSTGATSLVNAVANLNANTTQANLVIAQQEWKNLRSTWELSEAFLFGPVADQNLDPNVDDWPVNKNDFDSVLVSSSPLTDSVVANYQTSLKGFHALEYILFDVNQSKQASNITAREKQYMTAIANDLKSNCTKMYTGWEQNNGNYYTTFTTTNSVYTNKLQTLITMVDAMAGICGEVGEGKIKGVYDGQDATQEESQFSNNSFADFKNNITGVRNVYLGVYKGTDDKGLEDIVRQYNLSLDGKIKQQMEVAINSFNGFTKPFGQAIFDERTQITSTINAINALKTTLETELKPLLQANIK